MKPYVLLLPEGTEPPEDGDFVTLWNGSWGQDVEIREATREEVGEMELGYRNAVEWLLGAGCNCEKCESIRREPTGRAT